MFTEYNKEIDLILIKYDVFVENYLQSVNNEAICKAETTADFEEIAEDFANHLFETKYKDFKVGDVQVCISEMYRYSYSEEA